MEIIRDLLWLWIFGALGGTGYILWAVLVRDAAPATGRPQDITTRRSPPVARPAAPPVARPAPVTPAAPAVSGAEPQRRGSAPTVKLEGPGRKTSDDQAAADLFSGLGAAKAKADAAPPIQVPQPPQLAPPKDVVEKAVRLEERGFHVGAAKPAEPQPAATAPPAPVAADAAPRTQTAELDDILKRIDAVLSESNAPSSEATLSGGAQPTMPVAQPPPTEKLERKATDPNQQKLF